MSLLKKSLCIVYHSPYGHTAKVASYIAQGAKTLAVDVHLMSIEHIDWDALDAAHGIIFGSPTYMGSVSADFKKFMDSTSKRWKNRLWQGKLAAGFANSGCLSGDKLAVLQQLESRFKSVSVEPVAINGNPDQSIPCCIAKILSC